MLKKGHMWQALFKFPIEAIFNEISYSNLICKVNFNVALGYGISSNGVFARKMIKRAQLSNGQGHCRIYFRRGFNCWKAISSLGKTSVSGFKTCSVSV